MTKYLPLILIGLLTAAQTWGQKVVVSSSGGLPSTSGITEGYVPKVQADGSLAWEADTSSAGSGISAESADSAVHAGPTVLNAANGLEAVSNSVSQVTIQIDETADIIVADLTATGAINLQGTDGTDINISKDQSSHGFLKIYGDTDANFPGVFFYDDDTDTPYGSIRLGRGSGETVSGATQNDLIINAAGKDVILARDNTSVLEIRTNGAVNVAGDVTATSFTGDGSGLTDIGTNALSAAAHALYIAGGGGGDSVTVLGTAIDTTANFTTSTPARVTVTLSDGGGGGPDDVILGLANEAVDITQLFGGSGAAENAILTVGGAGSIDWRSEAEHASDLEDDLDTIGYAQLDQNETVTGDWTVGSGATFTLAAGATGDFSSATMQGSNMVADVVNATNLTIVTSGTAPTPSAGDDGTSIATTAYVRDENQPVPYRLSTNRTWTASEFRNAVIYVEGTSTQTLSAVSVEQYGTFIAIGSVTVTVDVNGSDQVSLNGASLDSAGDGVVSTGTAGDMGVVTYYSADGWSIQAASHSTNNWTSQ